MDVIHPDIAQDMGVLWLHEDVESDSACLGVIEKASRLLDARIEAVLEAFGAFYIRAISHQGGYGPALMSLGSNMAEFLTRFAELDLRLPGTRMAYFKLDSVTPDGLLLTYLCSRSEMWHAVSGALKAASVGIYQHHLSVELVGAGKSEGEVVMRLSYPYQKSMRGWQQKIAAAASPYPVQNTTKLPSAVPSIHLPPDLIYTVFPFHFAVDDSLRFVQVGEGLLSILPSLQIGTDLLTQHLNVIYPPCNSTDTSSLLSVIQRHSNGGFCFIFEHTSSLGSPSTPSTPQTQSHGPAFRLQGQMMAQSTNIFLFLGSLDISGPKGYRGGCASSQFLELQSSHGVTVSDLSLFDRSVDLALLAQHSDAETRTKESYEALTSQLKEEKARWEALLYRCLPRGVAKKLRSGQPVEATAHQQLTIVFTDIVDFTSISSSLEPMQVCEMLNELYERFDSCIDLYPDVFKADVIGDSYMLVANLSGKVRDHVDQVVELTLQMHAVARRMRVPYKRPLRPNPPLVSPQPPTPIEASSSSPPSGGGQDKEDRRPLMIRVGIHTGRAVAGVVGRPRSDGLMRFSVFGDSVNTASSMESYGVPGQVHLSQASYDLLIKPEKYEIVARGPLKIKGKTTPITTYLIKGHQEMHRNRAPISMSGM